MTSISLYLLFSIVFVLSLYIFFWNRFGRSSVKGGTIVSDTVTPNIIKKGPANLLQAEIHDTNHIAVAERVVRAEHSYSKPFCHLISNFSYVSATADVRGNLGSPEVVLNEKMDDWLNDRFAFSLKY